jgi:glycolate oxidase FAD binding subunit
MIAGVEPRETLAPRSVDELARAIRDLSVAQRAFAIVGGGTELGLGNAPRALDTVVRTTHLNRIVDYAPEDQTVTVEAGVTFEQLDRALAEHGQMFPLDVVDRARVTVGGAIATNAFGRRRVRYGTIKDLILGVEIVRPDGTPSRGGGKVVKNVAGFDLPKLMVGALGSLGAIATATFRVYPVPPVVRAVALTIAARTQLDDVLAAMVETRLVPESVVLYGNASLVITFTGNAAGVDAQMTTAQEIARAHGAEARELSDLERESYDQREQAVRRDGAWRLRVTAPPARMAAGIAISLAASPLAAPVEYPTVGVSLHAYAEGDYDLDSVRAHVARETNGAGAVVVTEMPDTARGSVDAWGAPPPAFALMKTLKQRFDPSEIANTGRFIGGL